MNLTKIIKREILITSLTVIGIAITFFGLTYAIYFTIDEKNIGTVSFGQLSFDMCMDESCSTGGTTYGTTITGDVYPMNTTEGTSQTPYLFKVTNNATDVMYTKVYAAKEGASIDYTNVKLAAKVQGTSTYSYADLTQDASVLIDLQVPAGQTKIIEVYMWLDEEASNEVIGKTVTAFINAIGYIKPDDPNNLHTGDKHVANVSAPLLQGQTFSYTGSYQEFEAPVSGYYFIETWGAQGGSAGASYPGGKGGYSSGYLYLSKGEKIYIYVGGEGESTTDSSTVVGGGYNGGGTAKTEASSGAYATSGGGATDIRYFGSATPSDSDLVWSSVLGLNSRIMVAGGGAGSGYNSSNASYFGLGGAGGTLISNNGTCNQGDRYGTAGSQTSGGFNYNSQSNTDLQGTFGAGGNTTTSTGLNSGSGGGGYYGGGSGEGYRSGGGGGSSFISGYAGSNAITSASDRTHTNNAIHYSGKYFLDGYMKSGVNEGNGQAKIKYVGLVEKENTKLDNVRYIKDCLAGNSKNGWNAWVEVQAIKDGTNLAKGITPTGITAHGTYGGPVANITDGNILTTNYTNTTAAGNYTNECVIIDLGVTYNLDELALWHYYEDGRVYYSNITSVSSNNSTWTEVINETMSESVNAKRVSAYRDIVNGYISDGLLVWYDGISNTGTTRSTSTTTWKNLASSSNDGTISGGTWENDNLYLSGSSSGVVSASTISYGTSNTSEAVVKISNTPAFVIDMRNSSGVGMQPLYSSNSAAAFQIYASASGSSDYALTSYYNTKASFSALLNSNGNKLYTNGILVASGAVTKGMSGSANLYVGRRYSNSSNLKGNVYSVRFYNRALSEDEVYHNYLVDKERFGLE